MKTIKRTPKFIKWFDGLADKTAKARIAIAITRVANGHGVTKSVGGGVREIKLTIGPGYRVYYTERGGELIVLLTGGDKGSQSRDIAKAKEIAAQLE
ncbi:MAG: type II toxin-antitoxin system RelE/ParE family toxin [Novosphingobium sp.]|nr:type II toxin-antitoxin system RelE/ParE family toxin [Novosphingobium sp.]